MPAVFIFSVQFRVLKLTGKKMKLCSALSPFFSLSLDLSLCFGNSLSHLLLLPQPHSYFSPSLVLFLLPLSDCVLFPFKEIYVWPSSSLLLFSFLVSSTLQIPYWVLPWWTQSLKERSFFLPSDQFHIIALSDYYINPD